MTIIEILNRLATIAPDVCKKIAYSDGPTFVIGSYSFWYDSLGNFQAYTSVVATGRAALAWLRDALEEEIERHGWNWREEKLGKCCASVYKGQTWRLANAIEVNIATALLAAFLAAVEGER